MYNPSNLIHIVVVVVFSFRDYFPYKTIIILNDVVYISSTI